MLVPASALALAIASPTIPAEQDPLSKVSVTWSASPGCDGDGPLRAHLQRLLASSTQQATGAVDVELRPSKAPGVGPDLAPRDLWTMKLRISSPEGSWSRRIDGESCRRMIEVAALIAAINLDPIAVQATLSDVDGSIEGGPMPAPPAPVPELSPTRSQDPPQRSPPDEIEDSIDRDGGSTSAKRTSPAAALPPEPRRPSRLGAAARVAILGSYGPFPGLGALIVGGLGLTIDDRFLFGVAAIHRLRSRHAPQPVPQVELLASLTAARIDACWTPRLGVLELPLCAGLDLGALRVAAIGLQNSTTDTSPYVAPQLSGRLLWRPSPTVGLGLDLGAGIALTRRTYGVRGSDETLLATTPIAAHGGLSLEIRLP